MTEDIRWQQRFENFKKALSQLKKFVDKGNLNELEEQGLIKSFEYTYEMAWNTIKDYYENQAEESIQGSRDAIRLAFKRGLIIDGDGWMNMVKDRIQTVHTYNEATANQIARHILDTYYGLFNSLKEKMQTLV